MEQSGISVVKSDPRRFLDFLKSNRYAVYHRSNIFFRDFQYGLWRFLKENQTKISYADMERLTADVVADWEEKGMLKRINRQSFELNMPEYSLAIPASQNGTSVTEPPKGKPVPASGPAAKQAPAATDDPEKAAKLAELQAKMAAAKAKREASDDTAATPAAAAPPPPAAQPAADAPTLAIPPGTDPEKAAKIRELQARMAEARAKREAGGA